MSNKSTFKSSKFFKNQENKDDKEKILFKNDIVKDDKDFYVIEKENENYQISKKDFEKDVLFMKEYSNVNIKNLPSEAKKKFDEIIGTMEFLYETQSLYESLLKEIKNKFSDVKVIKPGTVASFFIGCFNNDNFVGNSNCNPKCVDSLKLPKDSMKVKPCEYVVMFYIDGKLKRLNDVSSNKAIIYIEDSKFENFTKENVNDLKKENIESISLLYPGEDGNYEKQTPFENLENIKPTENKNPNPTFDSNGNSQVLITVVSIILSIFFIFLLIVIIDYFMKK
jgi:hypothetical protein